MSVPNDNLEQLFAALKALQPQGAPEQYNNGLEILRNGGSNQVLNFTDCKLSDAHVLLICEILKREMPGAMGYRKYGALQLAGTQDFSPALFSEQFCEVLKKNPNVAYTMYLTNTLAEDQNLKKLWGEIIGTNAARILSFDGKPKQKQMMSAPNDATNKPITLLRDRHLEVKNQSELNNQSIDQLIDALKNMPPENKNKSELYNRSIEKLRFGGENSYSLEFGDCNLTDDHVRLICEILKRQSPPQAGTGMHYRKYGALQIYGAQAFSPAFLSEQLCEVLAKNPDVSYTIYLSHTMSEEQNLKKSWQEVIGTNAARILSFEEKPKQKPTF